MAIIDLTALSCQSGAPRMMDWGSTLTPTLGGVRQRVRRLGTRFALDFTVPPIDIEGEGRRTIALLQQAKQHGGRVLYPQVEFDTGSPGAPTVSGAVAGGLTLPITGATPNYAVRPGQALNIIRADRRYLYFAAAGAVLNAAGAGNITLTTMLRTMLAGGESVTLDAPVIEGWLEGEDFGWTVEASRHVGLSFTIEERA